MWVQDVSGNVCDFFSSICYMDAGDQVMRFASAKRCFHALDRGHRGITGNPAEYIGYRLPQTFRGIRRIAEKCKSIGIDCVNCSGVAFVMLDNRSEGCGKNLRIERPLQDALSWDTGF